jgi:hypothetical protein
MVVALSVVCPVAPLIKHSLLFQGKKVMPKKAQVITIEEKPGSKYPDLESAQRAALPSISASLQAVVRELMDSGILVNVNGKLIPAGKDQRQ